MKFLKEPEAAKSVPKKMGNYISSTIVLPLHKLPKGINIILKNIFLNFKFMPLGNLIRGSTIVLLISQRLFRSRLRPNHLQQTKKSEKIADEDEKNIKAQ